MKATVINNNESANVVNNLPSVEIEDDTTTKSAKPGGPKETANDLQKPLSKNEVFAKLNAFFTPEGCVFDDSEIVNGMRPLVESGILPAAAMNAAIEKAKKDFEAKNKETLRAAENITFDEFLNKLQANKQLYNEVCDVCKVSEITQSMVFDNEGRIIVYRGGQGQDKDGNNRYTEGVVTRTSVNGKEFSEKIYYELRNENNVSSYVAAIRYYSFYLDALKKASNACKDSEKVLTYAIESVKKALSEGFSIEDITAAL